jgi:lambda family phage portal protein
MLVDQYGAPLVATPQATTPKRSRSRQTAHARYDAAQDTHDNRKHWQWADERSSAAANSSEVRRRLRMRARYECHEANSFAKGICLTLANDTISTGPSLQVALPDRTMASLIEREWRKWCKATGLAAKLRTARLSKVVDGEVFILKTTNRRLRTPVQLDVQLIEADQIATPGFMDGVNGQVDGIEFDSYRQPIRYHMLENHPGDIWAVNAWRKIDIDPEDIIHMFRVERPGQVRGVPEITTALPLFAYLRRLTLATIAASETAANFAAVLETSGNPYDDEDNGGPEDFGDPFQQVEIDRNMMTSLPRGWKMSQFKPEQPTTNYTMFRNAILNEIARCVHMPSNKALADSSAYNYSSGRLDHQTYYEGIDVERSHWEIDCMDRIFEWWLDEALMLTGYLSLDSMDELPHAWRWNPAKHVDPGKEVGAAIDAIEAGLLTEEQYLHSQNIDPEEHYEQLRRQALRKRQLAALAMDPTAPNGSISPLPAGDGPGVRGQSPATGAPTAPTSAPTGEFASMSRSQLKRNMAAIDDALDNLQNGTWTETRTRVFLSSVGMSERTIDNLLDELLESAVEDAD